MLASLGARLFAIPYWPAVMTRDAIDNRGVRQMTSRRWEAVGKSAHLHCRWRVCDDHSDCDCVERARFFVERYRLYTVQRGALYTGTIVHEAWPVTPAHIERLEQSLTSAVAGLPHHLGAPAHCCFSPGVGPVDFTMLRAM